MENREKDFVYITYIATTPEKLWQALIEPAFTRQYFFGVEFETDWKPSSVIQVPGPEGKKQQCGRVHHFEPPRLLAYTFDGPAHGPGGERRATLATFEIQAHGGGVRLYLTHSHLEPADLDPRKDTFAGLNNGWPAILSSLKSLVETGAPLELTQRWPKDF